VATGESGCRILVVLRGFYGNARRKACESNEADRYQMIAAPPLMHRKGHAGSGDQQRHQDAICDNVTRSATSADP
jgi:hypothetical protein